MAGFQDRRDKEAIYRRDYEIKQVVDIREAAGMVRMSIEGADSSWHELRMYYSVLSAYKCNLDPFIPIFGEKKEDKQKEDNLPEWMVSANKLKTNLLTAKTLINNYFRMFRASKKVNFFYGDNVGFGKCFNLLSMVHTDLNRVYQEQGFGIKPARPSADLKKELREYFKT